LGVAEAGRSEARPGQGRAKITFCASPSPWVVNPGNREVICLLLHCGQRVSGPCGAHLASRRHLGTPGRIRQGRGPLGAQADQIFDGRLPSVSSRGRAGVFVSRPWPA